MNKAVRKVGIYGGSFDPVHHGHMRSALEVVRHLHLDELRLVPSGNPPHRSQPRVDAAHRKVMLELASANVPEFVVDPREMERQQPSYTIDTLEAIQVEVPQATLTLIIGMDQFSAFDTWHRWQELLQRVDLAVMERPGESLSASARELMSGQLAERITIIKVTQLDISSSQIRHDLQHGKDIQFLVHFAVRRYISEHRLYGGPTPLTKENHYARNTKP